jgi:hypothetical protein
MSLTLRGLGQSRIVWIFALSMVSLAGERMKPRYSTVVLENLHFEDLAYKP